MVCPTFVFTAIVITSFRRDPTTLPPFSSLSFFCVRVFSSPDAFSPLQRLVGFLRVPAALVLNLSPLGLMLLIIYPDESECECTATATSHLKHLKILPLAMYPPASKGRETV